MSLFREGFPSLSFFLDVTLNVEVREKNQDRNAIEKKSDIEDLRESTRYEQIHRRMDDHSKKLSLKLRRTSIDRRRTRFTYDLSLSDVTFPPEILLNARSTRTQTVVGVHDHMNERIENGNEHRWKKEQRSEDVLDQIPLTLATTDVFQSVPSEEDHRDVMVDMKKRDLLVFLSQNEDNLNQRDLHRYSFEFFVLPCRPDRRVS